MASELHCWSCEHYRIGGCARGIEQWPDATPQTCAAFEYEPGSDEMERDE